MSGLFLEVIQGIHVTTNSMHVNQVEANNIYYMLHLNHGKLDILLACGSVYIHCKLPLTSVSGSMIRDIHHLTMVHAIIDILSTIYDAMYTILSGRIT